ncbi:dnaJ homolog subfamily C member 11-like [Acropora palmata]|uniref:dnaJ homolog subfamily C member 11-like n=1 Tax=Acropora palmata TaxID=6131 RepID=UPI003D9FE398
MAESEDSDKVVDYYAILNVRKEANENEIKAAYRRMCMLYHPDNPPTSLSLAGNKMAAKFQN